MNLNVITRKTQTQLLDIPSAAYQAGYSTRHFRRIIEEDHIPVLRIGHKDFITANALNSWNALHGEARLEQCIKQLDRWLQEDGQRTQETVSFEDEDDE